MTNPDKTTPETVPIENPETQIENPETQIEADLNELTGGQKNIEKTLEGERGNSKADEIIEEGRKNVSDGKECSSDFEEEKYKIIFEKINRNEELSKKEKEELEKEYEKIYKKINRNERLPENEREDLSKMEERMLKEIGIGVYDIINEDMEFTAWRNMEKEDKKVDIRDKNVEFKDAFEFKKTLKDKKDKKEIKEAREEIAEKRKDIEKATKESIEKYKEMENEFGKILRQDKACNILNEKEKEELQRILGSLSAVVKNEIDLTKLKYIETELDNPDKLLRDHSYRLAKIENLKKAADFFENGLEKLGKEEGNLLEQFLEWLKEHPELLEVAALIALAAGFAFLAEPAAEAIAATGITLKLAGAVKSAAIMGCLMAGYALADEKQRDKFMAWITGTGKVPDWAWWGSTHKYEQEKK